MNFPRYESNESVTPEEAAETIEELFKALVRTMELERVRDGMILLNGIGLLRQEMVRDPVMDHQMDQLRAAFNEHFGLGDVEWEIFRTEMEMDGVESFIALHPEFKDEILGDDD